MLIDLFDLLSSIKDINILHVIDNLKVTFISIGFLFLNKKEAIAHIDLHLLLYNLCML